MIIIGGVAFVGIRASYKSIAWNNENTSMSIQEVNIMMNSKKITVEAAQDQTELLNIVDAMQQAMDFFILLTDDRQTDIVWKLVSASTNSPFTAEAAPVDRLTNAPADDKIQHHLNMIERNLDQLCDGGLVDQEFLIKKREIFMRICKRNMNGIGRTLMFFGDDTKYEIWPELAARAIKAMNIEEVKYIEPGKDEEYEYLFKTYARKEHGSIDGRIISLNTDYDEPSIKIKEHATGREIHCRIAESALDGIKSSVTAGDVWEHRRARIKGVINYDQNGKIVRVYDCTLAFIKDREVTLDDIHDPEFTGELPILEYIDKLRENELE